MNDAYCNLTDFRSPTKYYNTQLQHALHIVKNHHHCKRTTGTRTGCMQPLLFVFAGCIIHPTAVPSAALTVCNGQAKPNTSDFYRTIPPHHPYNYNHILIPNFHPFHQHCYLQFHHRRPWPPSKGHQYGKRPNKYQ